MAQSDETLLDPAADGFERYYAEKLWEWVPAVYRHEDGLATNPNPHVLRAIVEILGLHAAVARRSIDRLWDDQFIDTCDDWVVPYLADLVGTRLLSSLNRRARRVDVARTIFYRRRKGTPVVMEALIQDITGWEGAVVESFRRLGRARHGLDPEPGPLAGPVTGTPPGGTADLRAARGGDVADGPFDDFAHTPDVRRHRGWKGRYNIPKLNFHLYRLRALEVELATPVSLGARRFTFDPSGRDVPLFSPDQRRVQDCAPVREWQLPAPIPCRLFNRTPERFTPAAVAVLLAADPTSGTPLDATELLAGNLETWDVASAAAVEAVIDPERGRLLLTDDHPVATVHVPRYHHGLPGDIGAGTYSRPIPESDAAATHTGPDPAFTFPSAGVHEITDSTTYQATAPADGDVELDNLQLLARDGQRPYVVLAPEGETWVLRAPEPEEGEAPQDLLVDGLWLGFPSSADPAPLRRTLALDGRFGTVRLRHCTLDPGGVRADGETLPYIELEIRGEVRELVIERSIVGPVRESTSDIDPCSVGRILICDSIVHALDDARPALLTRIGEVRLERVTVFGRVEVNRLYASETLVQGVVDVTDNQHSCIRFSAAQRFDGQHYESHVFPRGVPNHFFTSRRFGEPAYGQLSRTVPEVIRRGAENRSEIGAYSALLDPIKRDDLEAKVLEYMPFGLIPQFIFET